MMMWRREGPAPCAASCSSKPFCILARLPNPCRYFTCCERLCDTELFSHDLCMCHELVACPVPHVVQAVISTKTTHDTCCPLKRVGRTVLLAWPLLACVVPQTRRTSLRGIARRRLYHCKHREHIAVSFFVSRLPKAAHGPVIKPSPHHCRHSRP